MKSTNRLLIVSVLGFFLIWGCSSESDSSNTANQKEIILGKIELSNSWARPGSKNQTSGIYLTISNGTASTDTLLGVTSEAANSAEIHESIENEDGTISMRPAGKQVIRDGHKLELTPGGLHIMLMDLKRDVTEGDSLSVSLQFARVGSKTLKVPVQTDNK